MPKIKFHSFPADQKGIIILPKIAGIGPGDYITGHYFCQGKSPPTPTVHALRGDRYKYIRYHGIWDVDELYDLQEDPLESRNLIASREHQEIGVEMNRRLFGVLEETGGMSIPLREDRGRKNGLRRPDLAAPAAFPEPLVAPEGT